MSNKLYVGNLPFETDSAELEKHFAGSGTVDTINIIKDRDTGRLKGFGFIEMSSADEANQAIEDLNEKDFGGRPLRVNLAKDDNAKRRDSNSRY